MRQFLICVLLFILIFSCKENKQDIPITDNNETTNSHKVIKKKFIDLFKSNQNHISNGFDFPIGKLDTSGYYNAQKFQENNHLGEDWNGVRGGNSDLGDPIYAIANGYANQVKDYGGGWGNVIRIIHLHKGQLYESIYAHCDTTLIEESNFVKKGTKIATIGNCNGIYLAHLHFEIRDSLLMDIGSGYSNKTKGYLNPTKFINKNRE
ncbi:M23 family metallopeptidase [Hyunsoonleella pacifica]|uniref:M23 family metallopeptidase n=1 Tax=Hyunsoonleella pacifica TaxID=1080224 RepID=A0A4Q9FRF6_9FLAO|nr:M23 family metallopeptidase [Hyunsoonleella pacifica]TBN17426.1 M23 family metallopeptidase [Hyunsoonleella pacifica]GGD12060.1 peptidase M23 [Hyunsoonleella pacifica]